MEGTNILLLGLCGPRASASGCFWSSDSGTPGLVPEWASVGAGEASPQSFSVLCRWQCLELACAGGSQGPVSTPRAGCWTPGHGMGEDSHPATLTHWVTLGSLGAFTSPQVTQLGLLSCCPPQGLVWRP